MRLKSIKWSLIYHPFPPTSTTNHQFTPFITLFHRPPPSSTAVHHSTPFITLSHQPPPSSTAVHNSTPFITLSHQSPPSSTTNHHFTLSITLFYHPPPLFIILHHLSHFSTLLPHWSSFYTIYSIVHMYGNWHKSWNEPQFPLIWIEYFSQLSICMVIDLSFKILFFERFGDFFFYLSIYISIYLSIYLFSSNQCFATFNKFMVVECLKVVKSVRERWRVLGSGGKNKNKYISTTL